jgi:triosephosphate isomerase (TIM)
MRTLIVGNWKMNGLRKDLAEIEAIAAGALAFRGVDVGLCVPATLIAEASNRVPNLTIGAQDCHSAASGAHTGCLSVPMIAEAGARMVIVGHSERRGDNQETSADVMAKATAAIAGGLNTIICVGESEADRDAGNAITVVNAQLRGSLPLSSDNLVPVIAYEPVWAIGTGRTASVADVREMHSAVRQTLVELLGDQGAKVRILYGGSVKASNAAELLAVENVNGALVGGASLKAADFLPIVAAAQAKVD